MAKKTQNTKIGNELRSPVPSANPAPVQAAPAKVTTPIRNTAVPPRTTAPAPKREITHEMIARRAYEISQSPQCGSEFDNWVRAERELKGL